MRILKINPENTLRPALNNVMTRGRFYCHLFPEAELDGLAGVKDDNRNVLVTSAKNKYCKCFHNLKPCAIMFVFEVRRENAFNS